MKTDTQNQSVHTDESNREKMSVKEVIDANANRSIYETWVYDKCSNCGKPCNEVVKA